MSSEPDIQQTSATPILDRLVPLPRGNPPEAEDLSSPRRRSRFALWFALAFFLLPVAWIASMVWVPGVRQQSEKVTEPVSRLLDSIGNRFLLGKTPLSNFLIWFILVPVLVFCATAVVHELGHLIAGGCMGFRFNWIHFGPVKITRGFHFSLIRPKAPRLGATSMTLKTHPWGRMRTIVFILGGPFANLIVAFFILRGNVNLPFAGLFAVVSLVIGITNLLPLQERRFATDGKRIVLVLRRRSPELERQITLLQFSAAMKKGATVETLSPHQIKRLVALREPSAATVAAHVLAYLNSWDKGPDSETAHRIEVALQFSTYIAPSLRETVVCAAGLFQAAKKNNTVLAREWLAEIPEPPLRPDSRLRLEAAILEAEGAFNAALQKLNEVEQALPKSTTRLQHWRSQIEEKARATSAAT